MDKSKERERMLLIWSIILALMLFWQQPTSMGGFGKRMAGASGHDCHHRTQAWPTGNMKKAQMKVQRYNMALSQLLEGLKLNSSQHASLIMLVEDIAQKNEKLNNELEEMEMDHQKAGSS